MSKSKITLNSLNQKETAEAVLPTKFGIFKIYVFKGKQSTGRSSNQNPVNSKNPIIGSGENVVLLACHHPLTEHKNKALDVRVHSKCFTGDTLHSLRCDCNEQMEKSLKYINKRKCGMFIYLDQEGRGIGLSNKIRAYALQDMGADTIEANLALGFKVDLRDYSDAADILKFFNIKKINLLTNSPTKVADLRRHGIYVVKHIPLKTKKNKYNEKYIKTKKEKMGQWL